LCMRGVGGIGVRGDGVGCCNGHRDVTDKFQQGWLWSAGSVPLVDWPPPI
jgi:hypothetical protein